MKTSNIFYLFYIASLSLLLGSCSPDSSENRQAKIHFKIPDFIKASGEVSTSGSRSCFAVSLRGPGITKSTPTGTCDASYGQFVGLVAAGEDIEIDVKYGKERTLDLYYVASAQGCADFDGGKGLIATYGSNNVYRISRNTGLNFNAPQMNLTIPVKMPTSSNSMAQLVGGLSASCIKKTPQVLAANARARVVLGAGQGVTNNGSQMRVRILDQKINIAPGDWSGQIRPHRLGDEP